MKAFRYITGVVLLYFGLSNAGCIAPPKMTTKGASFPSMYAEPTRTVLVLPPINLSTSAEAKEYYATTVAEPLGQMGYYVLPVEISTAFLREQGMGDTELLVNQPFKRFGDLLGADAVLVTRITKWDKAYAVLAANLTVGVDARLISTHNQQTLWSYAGMLRVDLTQHSNSGNPIADLIVGAVATSIAAAAADYVPVAKRTNEVILYTMPYGPYRTESGKDQEIKFREPDPTRPLLVAPGQRI